MYGKNGNNGGGSDSGKWQIEDGKLCMSWQRWEYEGCGQLVRVGDKVQHLYPNSSAVHLVFNKKKNSVGSDPCWLLQSHAGMKPAQKFLPV